MPFLRQRLEISTATLLSHLVNSGNPVHLCMIVIFDSRSAKIAKFNFREITNKIVDFHPKLAILSILAHHLISGQKVYLASDLHRTTTKEQSIPNRTSRFFLVISDHLGSFFVNHFPVDTVVRPFALPFYLAPWISETNQLKPILEMNLERKTYLIANIRGQRIDQRIGMSGNKSVTSLGLNAST